MATNLSLQNYYYFCFLTVLYVCCAVWLSSSFLCLSKTHIIMRGCTNSILQFFFFLFFFFFFCHSDAVAFRIYLHVMTKKKDEKRRKKKTNKRIEK